MAMPRRPLTKREFKAAKRVRETWLRKKRALRLNQTIAAHAVDWDQSTFNHYLHGRIPLNVDAVLRFSVVLQEPAMVLAPEIVSHLDGVIFYPESLSGSSGRKERSRGKGSARMVREEGGSYEASAVRLAEKIMALSDEDRQRVDAFVDGLKISTKGAGKKKR